MERNASLRSTEINVTAMYGVGELVDNAGWLQARVDLSPYGGRENLRLRFDFSTAGSFDLGSAGFFGLGADYILYNRESRYDEFEDVSQRTPTLRLYLTWNG